jgi:hypothetical protein
MEDAAGNTNSETAQGNARIAPGGISEPSQPVPPDFAPLHYLGEACRIAIWDAAAIQRTAKDPRALPYGIGVWVLANSLSFFVVVVVFRPHGLAEGPGGLLFKIAVDLLRGALSFVIYFGLCFTVAKWFMGAEGHFVNLIRPLLLGSIVFVLVTIPIVGPLIALLAWVCVYAMVFQVVADIEALHAYVLCLSVVVAVRVLEWGLKSALG